MTPLQLSILLHYKIETDDWYNGHDVTKHEEVRGLRDDHGLLTGHGATDAMYKLTDKGHAFIDGLCATKLPVVKWVMPE